MNISISVVTVVYNGKSHIADTVRSVIGQDYDNFQYVVLDGNSNDGTFELLQSNFIQDIDILISEPDNGIYDAMNKAVELCSGDFVVFMNSGDRFYNPSTLSLLSNNIIGHDGVYGQTILEYVDNKGRLYNFKRKLHSLEKIHRGPAFCHQALLLRKNLIQRFGFNLNNLKYADYELVYRSIYSGARLKFVDTFVNYFLLGGLSSKPDIRASYICWMSLKDIMPLGGHIYYATRVFLVLPVKYIFNLLLPRTLINQLKYNSGSL